MFIHALWIYFGNHRFHELHQKQSLVHQEPLMLSLHSHTLLSVVLLNFQTHFLQVQTRLMYTLCTLELHVVFWLALARGPVETIIAHAVVHFQLFFCCTESSIALMTSSSMLWVRFVFALMRTFSRLGVPPELALPALQVAVGRSPSMSSASLTSTVMIFLLFSVTSPD